MKVTGINSAESKPYDLVEIFLFGDECPIKSFKCYVLPGIMKYNLDIKSYDSFMTDCKDLPNFVDPLRAETDHGEGLGLILGPGAIGDISADNPSYYKSHLVDHTYYGPAVSGRLPNNVTQTIAYRADLDFTFFKDEVADDTFFHDEASIDAKIKLLGNLEFLRDKELLGVKAQEMHQEDVICFEKFEKELSYDSIKKQYTVALPFKNNKSSLPNNEWIALKRTRILQRAFMKDRNYALHYVAQMDKLLVSDFIEEVLSNTEVGDIIHYLPHRGVVKEDSKTTSLRIVMDASCRSNASSLCLNDTLYTGPNMTITIAQLMLKFRLHKYGAVSDIEKAFLQLIIRTQDRDALRFFFPVDIFNPSSPMRVLRYKRVMFGASCSPFLLAAVIETHLENHVKDTILKKSLKNIFIDNLLFTGDTEIELIEFYHKARSIFSEMGLNLRQWASNSQQLVELAKNDGVHDDSKEVKVLGHFWNPQLDEFSFNTNLKIKTKYSRRAVLSTGNQVIDTFGLLLPIEMRYRVFLQKLWTDQEKLGWDTVFKKKELTEVWDLIKSDLQQALTVKFPRSLETYRNVELHIFSDASFEAYGAVAYFVIPACKEYPQGITQLRYSKGKVVSPKRCPKGDTIPKLELMGVVMAANMAKNLLKAYEDIQFSKKVIWSDSQTVLCQLSQQVNKTNFVHNRVDNIRSLCPGFDIKYVKSLENPADLITRPIEIENFLDSKLWWPGPDWLPHKDKWKEDKYDLHLERVQNPLEEEWEPIKEEHELTTAYGMVTCFKTAVQVENSSNDQLGNLIENTQNNNSLNSNQVEKSPGKKSTKKVDDSLMGWHFSDYKSLVKGFALAPYAAKVLRYKTKLRKFPLKQKLRAAGERLAITYMQRECFPKELLALKNGEKVKNPKFLQLKLYLDHQGIIRIQGRLNDKHFTRTNKPILFGYRHPLTVLFILDRHKCYNCSGVEYTLNKIRKEIHSPKLRRQIREILNKCIVCKRILGLGFKYPENPPLEEYRTKCSRPFSMCGLDYIGPFFIHKPSENEKVNTTSERDETDKPNENIKSDKPKEPKAWIVLFSCLVSRAIYTVLVPDRGVESFLRALREMSARHCEPQLLISDNEKSFEAANKILQKIAERPKIIKELGKKNISWRFLPSRASWMGGVYERLVQIIKLELKKLQRKGKFTAMEWKSHLADIEMIVNDRPLTYVSDNPTEPEVITPNTIIHGSLTDTVLATDINIDEAIADMKRYQSNPESLYREKIKIKTEFWKKIQNDYISALNISNYKKNKSRGKYSSKIPEVGGVVSIQDSETKLGGRLGVIVKLLPSSDGVVRKAEVKTTIPSPHVNLHKNLRTVIRVKAINQLIPLELKVDTQTTIDVENFVNLNKTVNQAADNSELDRNLELDRNFDENETPIEEGGSCSIVDCKNPVGNIKWVECTECHSWCHYICLNIPNSKKFGEDEQFFCPSCLIKINSNNFEGFPSQNSEPGSGGLETFTPIESNTVQTNNVTKRPGREAKTKAKQNVKNWIDNS